MNKVKPEYLAALRLKPSEVAAVLTRSEAALLELCQNIGHGRIERLNIADGQPVLAECNAVQMVKLSGH